MLGLVVALLQASADTTGQLPSEESACSPLSGAAAPNSQGPWGGPPLVTVEIFFTSTCPHCQIFLQDTVVPLIRVGLPGEQVQLRLQPIFAQAPSVGQMISLLDQGVNAEYCRLVEDCYLALAPLWALNQTSLWKLEPIDSPVLGRLVEFVNCDLKDTAVGGLGRMQFASEDCARHSGLPVSGPRGLSASLGGPAGFEDATGATPEVRGAPALGLLKTGTAGLQQALCSLRNAGFSTVPGWPWVFVNGEFIRCMGSWCDLHRTIDGGRPLANPGSLLTIICGKLSAPKPLACEAPPAPPPGERILVQQQIHCESCVTVGKSRWKRRAHPAALLPASLRSACLAFVALSLCSCSWVAKQWAQRQGMWHRIAVAAEPLQPLE